MLSSFEELLQKIGDTESRLSISSLYGLSGMDRVETLLFQETWPSIAIERRRQIINFLVEIAEASFEVNFGPVFRFCLGDEDETVRAAAIEGLWEDNDTALINPLITMLRDDPSISVRAGAATSLGRYVLLGELDKIKPRPFALVREALLETIHSPFEHLEVRRRAIETIAYSSDEGVREIIETAYYDEDERMRTSAVLAMGRSADPSWADLVINELESSRPEMRYEAATASGELELLDAIPLLANLVNDPDREVLEAAIWALGQIGGNEARRILHDCYREDDEFLCEAVEEALEQLEFMSGFPYIPLDDLSDLY
ncbi:MAG: HEAT repeat domain-containing protein [Anaerolineales bacterium]|nr:HEAT repeat domain-containing protein [Anaerolineales bacterium]